MREPVRHFYSLLIAGICLLLFGARIAAEEGPSAGQDFALIERGHYLTELADCAACHDDPVHGRPFAGGRPIATPFGTLLAPNITPDRITGIGDWTEAQFDAAVRRGRMPDGQLLYPAMPYTYYRKMSKDDVRAIRAYLDTIAPAHNSVKSNQLPFPFNIRTSMEVWNSLYFREGGFQPDPNKSATWNRGAYIVEGPGHCGACHTPKTPLGGDVSERFLQGYAIQNWFAPNITNDQMRGLGAWSIDDIVAYLKSGHNRFAAASGPMGEEIAYSSSKMNDEDLKAIATYLKDQPGQKDRPARLNANDPTMQAGAAIYRDQCSACHKLDGSGVAYLIPNLANSSSVASRDATTILRVILQGAASVATATEPTGAAMPAYGKQLDDAQIAAVANYVRNSWGHAAAPVTASEVGAMRGKLAQGD